MQDSADSTQYWAFSIADIRLPIAPSLTAPYVEVNWDKQLRKMLA